ncbi:MAG: chemotaxis protein CheW [Deltaproteobacteria bacterium]|jgi:chemotaxis protein histidine kinase CheA|nr:chemotaxis protein CheW [Deltaproteobacteria bacterium]
MAVDTERLQKLLEQASLELVMLSRDDLVEVSAVLGLVESLGREFVVFESEWPPRVVNSVKSLLKAVIRDEVPDRAELALDLAGEGVTHLQELARVLASGGEPAGDIRGFLKRSADLTGQDYAAPPPPEGAASPRPEPEPEPPEDVAPPPPEEVIPPEERGPDWDDIDKGWGEDDLAARGVGANADDGATAEAVGEGSEGDVASGEAGESPSGAIEMEGTGAFGAEAVESSGADGAEADDASGADGAEAGDASGAYGAEAEDASEADGAEADETSGAYGGEADEASGADGAEAIEASEADKAAEAYGEEAAGARRKATVPSEGEGPACRLVWRPRHKPTVEHFKQGFVHALESLQMKLVAVEQKNDPVSAMAECIQDFRTIQAGFSLLDLDELTRLTADTVALMDYVVSEQVPHTTQITDILLKALSFLIDGVSSLELREGDPGWGISPPWPAEEMKELRDSLWDARQGMLAPDPPSTAPASSGASRGAKPKKLGEILVEKGLISEGDLGGLIQAQKTARNVRLGEILVEDGLITESELQEAVELQNKEGNVRRMGEILVAMGRLDHEHVEKALKIQESRKETKLGEILLQKKIGAPEKVAAALREQKQSEFSSSASTQQQGAHTVKVETQKLDGLIDLVGELVITQSLVTSNESLKHLKEQKFNKDLAQVSRITSELQRNAMSLRMVVIKNTFQKMNRLVRDLSHKFEKDIEFTTIGDDTEIDRNMVESIYDPLVHMIRNALDHGIETAAERRAVGKPVKGALVLKAYHQGGNVVIELSDDGRGLDVAKVQQKAEEKGFIQPGETLTVAQAHNVVFQPGFSTTDKVTELSGRGVGMDVVRKSIEQLRGKVDFTSTPGQGSSFVIRLPLTLAIIDGMIVRVGDNRYILPTISINESFRPKPEEYFTVKNQGEMIKVRDNLLPLVRLDQIVNVDGAATDPSDALVVVVENEGQRRCLLVDEVLGKQEVVIKSLGERLKYVRSLAGGTILGDGRVGLILDVNGLFDSAGGSYGPPLGAHPSGGEADDWGM